MKFLSPPSYRFSFLICPFVVLCCHSKFIFRVGESVDETLEDKLTKGTKAGIELNGQLNPAYEPGAQDKPKQQNGQKFFFISIP